MKKYLLILIPVVLFALIFIQGCENDYPEDIWNPNYTTKPTPVISDISPDTTYSGIGEITISGQNFSENVADITVYFNGLKGTVLSATATELQVKVPTLIADSVKIQIHVSGAYLFGEYGGTGVTDVPFVMVDALAKYKSIDATTIIAGLACDLNENIYSILSIPRGIIQLQHPDSATFVQYSPSPTQIGYGIKWGPGNHIYLVRKNKNIYRVFPDASSYEIWAKVDENVMDLDFDQNGNLYTAGKEGKIFAIAPSADTALVARYGIDFDIPLLRVYGGYVYSVHDYQGTDTTILNQSIWRNQILDANGTLGPNELVFDWDAYMGRFGPAITAIVVDENGIFYIGNNYENNSKNEAITKLDIASGTAEALYPQILKIGVNNLVWGNGNYLYINRYFAEGSDDTFTETRELLRLGMPVKSAPYYGRQ